ncbi:MAG: hypothetical protein JSV99_11870 [Planctomycetota bacterium]|nr:MAG: hypothetical protein JSV99_11870 [Planctomycetota bacterium]
MKKKAKEKHLITLLAIIELALAGGLIGCKKTDDESLESQTYSKEAASVEETIVGVYDSRAIAFAYWEEKVDGKERQFHPKFNSDASALEYWGQEVDGRRRYTPPQNKALEGREFGYMQHQQVFSYHDPVQALEYIADKLPGVMKEAGVDVIVSKWDREELAKYGVVGSGWDEEGLVERNQGKVVDMTRRLVQLYNPSAEFLGDLKDFSESKPAPLDTDWLHAEE